MTDPKLLKILDSIETPDFNTNKPALHKLDWFLTLRTFLDGYILSEIDEQLWKALRLNKVTFGIVRSNLFLNVTRWFTHLESTYPALGKATKTPPKAAAAAAADEPGGRYNIKLQDTENGVITRFPPEPS